MVFCCRDSSGFESVMDMSGMIDSSQLSIETQTEETAALTSHGFEVVRSCQVMLHEMVSCLPTLI